MCGIGGAFASQYTDESAYAQGWELFSTMGIPLLPPFHVRNPSLRKLLPEVAAAQRIASKQASKQASKLYAAFALLLIPHAQRQAQRRSATTNRARGFKFIR